jgi:hypothetical protein
MAVAAESRVHIAFYALVKAASRREDASRTLDIGLSASHCEEYGRGQGTTKWSFNSKESAL